MGQQNVNGSRGSRVSTVKHRTQSSALWGTVPEPRNSVLDVLYGRHNGPTNVLFKQNQPGAGMAYTVLDKYDKYNWLLQLGELQHFANIVILKIHELKQHFVFNEKLTCYNEKLFGL